MPEVRDFLMPDLGEGLTEGEIVSWLVAVGNSVSVDQPVAEMSTEKAVVEVPTPFAGRVVALHGSPGDRVAVGRPLISIDVAGDDRDARSGSVLVGYGTSDEAAQPRARRATAGDPPAAVTRQASPPASPLVRRLAAERGIDLTTVSGTGPGGIVTRADLENAAPDPAAGADPASAGTRTRLTGANRVAAERLIRSHRDAPTAAASVYADATQLMELRSELDRAADGAHVTPFALVLCLCVHALQRFPRLNAHYDTERDEVVRFGTIHLGVAVQTDRGLVVPVIRDANDKSVQRIAAELERLAAAARDGSIGAADLRGSTFTVSNFGAFGVDGGTAIINPPEAAILGVGQIAERPWIVGGAVVPRQVVQLSLVFDHRVADGAVAGGFARHLADLIEQPRTVLADD